MVEGVPRDEGRPEVSGCTLHRAMRTRILVIEDKRSTSPVRWNVVFDSRYEVGMANRADHLRSHIRDFGPHLVIINSERRQVSNPDLCRKLRRYKELAHTPILLLTGWAEETVESLDAGADDCLVKPISFREFLLRVRGLLRRAQSCIPSTLRFADIVLDLDRCRVTRAGRDIALAPIEFKMLAYLMRAPGRTVPYSELLSAVWGPHACIEENTIIVCIGRLRKALRQDRLSDLIRTVRGVGYILGDGDHLEALESLPIDHDKRIDGGAEGSVVGRSKSCLKPPTSRSE